MEINVVNRKEKIVTDRDFYIYCGDVKLKVNAAIYYAVFKGDIIIVEKTTWTRNGAVWDIGYEFKGKK